MVSQKPKYCKNFERNSHWRKLSMIMVWKRYCNASLNPEFLFIFFVYIFIHVSANMSPFRLKFAQMILHTETSKLMYNWSFLFVVLHKPTLLPSTFKKLECGTLILYQVEHTSVTLLENVNLVLTKIKTRIFWQITWVDTQDCAAFTKQTRTAKIVVLKLHHRC